MTDLTKLSDEDLIEKIKLNLIDYISHQSFYKEDHEEELKARLASLREYEASELWESMTYSHVPTPKDGQRALIYGFHVLIENKPFMEIKDQGNG